MKNLVAEILPKWAQWRLCLRRWVAIQFKMTKGHATIYLEIADSEGGMRCTVKSHQHSSAKRSSVIGWRFRAIWCWRRRKGVQALIPVALLWRVWAFPDDLVGHIIQARYKPGKGGCTLFGEKLEYVLVWVSNEVSNWKGEAIMWWRMSGALENEFFKSGSWSPQQWVWMADKLGEDRECMRRWQKPHTDGVCANLISLLSVQLTKIKS